MDTQMPELYSRRLYELEKQFSALESQIDDSPQKQALSILPAMLHELWRNLRATTSPLAERDLTIQDIADLYLASNRRLVSDEGYTTALFLHRCSSVRMVGPLLKYDGNR